MTTPHTCSLPTAGPTVAGARGGPGGFPGGGPGGGAGGLPDASTPSSEVVTAPTRVSSSYRWVAAVGANSAAGYQPAARAPVVAIGGFNGSDPTPTLAELQALVAEGEVPLSIAGGMGGGPAGSQASSAIATWVAQTYQATTVGGTTMYDLSAGSSS